MREAVGGTWITQLVILFMLIFVAFLALSLNYTKAFKIKNEILSIIEKREGFTSGPNGSIAIINNYLILNGYRVTKPCDKGSYGVTSLTSNTAEYVSEKSNKKYYYCVTKIKSPASKVPSKAYYSVKIFFYFNLPILGDIFKFEVNGETGDVIFPADYLWMVQKEV